MDRARLPVDRVRVRLRRLPRGRGGAAPRGRVGRARQPPDRDRRPAVPHGRRPQPAAAAHPADHHRDRPAAGDPAVRGAARLAHPPLRRVPPLHPAGAGGRRPVRPDPDPARAAQLLAGDDRPRRARPGLAGRPEHRPVLAGLRDHLEGAGLRRDPVPGPAAQPARRPVRGDQGGRRRLLAQPLARDAADDALDHRLLCRHRRHHAVLLGLQLRLRDDPGRPGRRHPGDRDLHLRQRVHVGHPVAGGQRGHRAAARVRWCWRRRSWYSARCCQRGACGEPRARQGRAARRADRVHDRRPRPHLHDGVGVVPHAGRIPRPAARVPDRRRHWTATGRRSTTSSRGGC